LKFGYILLAQKIGGKTAPKMLVKLTTEGCIDGFFGGQQASLCYCNTDLCNSGQKFARGSLPMIFCLLTHFFIKKILH
jgi:hypothetical protein